MVIRGKSSARRSGALAFVCAMGLAGSSVAGQTTISGPPSCTPCRIEVAPLATLGGPQDPGSMRVESMLAVDATGDFLVGPLVHAGEIFVYGRDGVYKEKIGRAGAGPGEYGRSFLFTVVDDSVHVVDNSNRRHTVLAPDRTVARTRPLPARVRDFVVLESQTLVIEAEISSAERFGLPLHRLHPDQTVRNVSFGAPGTGVVDPGAPHDQMRVLANAGGDSVWVSHVNWYVLELFDQAGTVISRVFREVPWFERWHWEPTDAYLVSPPPPRVTDLAMNPQGLLLTAILVPAAAWAPIEPGVWTPQKLATQFDTVLEVLDPGSLEVLASRRFEGWVRPTYDGSLLYQVVEDDVGYTGMQIWRLDVVDPRPR